MIRPRRGAAADDPALVTGVVGAAAVLRAVRGALAELAADGDRGGAAPEAGDGHGDVVDVVLGLAALAGAVASALSGGAAAAPEPVEPAPPPRALAARELLR